MKIKNIKINNYGNLENKEINLNKKINIIYGKNESGKSTLLNYIKNIFYGISKNKNGKEISDYEKYKPWMKEEFSGKLKYELDSGESFEVFRDFNKKNPKVFNGNFEDISKEFNIDKKDGSQFFYEQTKVDETMFLSTVVSAQQEVRLDKQSQGVLVQKLANLAGTGNDNVSFKKALERLNKRQLDEVGTKRTQGRPINIVQDEMKNVEFVIKELNLYQSNKIELDEKKKDLEEAINNLEIKNNIIKKLNEINSEINFEKEKINLKNKIKNENEEKINKLNLEKSNLLENKKIIKSKNNNYEEKLKNSFKNKKIKNKIDTERNKHGKIKNKNIKYLIIFFILIIFSIIIKLINKKYFDNKIIDIFNYLIIPIYLIYIFIKINILNNKNKKIEYEAELNKKLEQEKIKNEENIIDTKIENIEEQIKQLMDENNKHTNEIENIQLELDNKIDIEIEKIKIEEQDKINVNELLDELDFNNIKYQVEKYQEELNKNKLLLNSIEIEEKNIIPKLENIITLKEKYKNLEEELNEIEEKDICFNLTREYLSKAYEQMKNSVTPKFTENLSKNIATISNNKYNKVMINDESGLIVENQFGEYITAEKLSVGTIDQLYLSLRLSMIDDISEETMPIILDEAFAYYDNERLENILKFLLDKTEKNQLIIFTCTDREKEIFNKLEVDYNFVEL